MQHLHNSRSFAALAIITVTASASTARAQFGEDWTVFVDDQTNTECDVVNASNAELVVLFETRRMAIVSGDDIILEDVLVAEDFSVTFEGQPAGIVQYAEDADGLPTVFWVTLTGTVVGIDTFTGEPFDSGEAPNQIGDTACDACDFVDNSPVCEQTPGGLPDLNFSLCGLGTMTPAMVAVALFPLLRFCRRRR